MGHVGSEASQPHSSVGHVGSEASQPHSSVGHEGSEASQPHSSVGHEGSEASQPIQRPALSGRCVEAQTEGAGRSYDRNTVTLRPLTLGPTQCKPHVPGRRI